jgi:hypothetical protein
MSKTTAFATALLDHLLNNADIALIGDATGLRGSSTAGSLYLSLHTADPGAAGAQNTSEVSYTNYARLAVARSTVTRQWTCSNAQAVNAFLLAWPIIGATPGSIATFVGIGTASSGAGSLLRRTSVSFPAWATGITPLLRPGDAVYTDA